MTVKDNQPTLAARLVDEPWDWGEKPDHSETARGHGRMEKRSISVLPVPEDRPLPGFPDARQMAMIVRERHHLDGTPMNKDPQQLAFVITSLSSARATPCDIAQLVRSHWKIENQLHHVRDVTFDEDRSRIRTGSGPRNMASFRNLAISILRLDGADNMAAATRACCFNMASAFKLLCGLCGRRRSSRQACA